MVLIIVDTDNSLWKHQPFLQALRKIQKHNSIPWNSPLPLWCVCAGVREDTIFILLQEDNLCITMRGANEISHQPAIHTY